MLWQKQQPASVESGGLILRACTSLLLLLKAENAAMTKEVSCFREGDALQLMNVSNYLSDAKDDSARKTQDTTPSTRLVLGTKAKNMRSYPLTDPWYRK